MTSLTFQNGSLGSCLALKIITSDKRGGCHRTCLISPFVVSHFRRSWWRSGIVFWGKSSFLYWNVWLFVVFTSKMVDHIKSTERAEEQSSQRSASRLISTHVSNLPTILRRHNNELKVKGGWILFVMCLLQSATCIL